jgi:putative phosphoribosyl transferase
MRSTIIHQPLREIFTDRRDAGEILAEKVSDLQGRKTLVLALPRGGVPIGYEVAKKILAPLDVFLVRKLGAPMNREYGFGAVTELETVFLDVKTVNNLGLTKTMVSKIIHHESIEIIRQKALYRDNRAISSVEGKTVLIVDDGLATGVTALAAAEAIHSLNPKIVVFAAPVCAYETYKEVGEVVDDIVCAYTSRYMQSVGEYYKNFSQVNDEDVLKLLHESNKVLAENISSSRMS